MRLVVNRKLPSRISPLKRRWVQFRRADVRLTNWLHRNVLSLSKFEELTASEIEKTKYQKWVPDLRLRAGDFGKSTMIERFVEALSNSPPGKRKDRELGIFAFYLAGSDNPLFQKIRSHYQFVDVTPRGVWFSNNPGRGRKIPESLPLKVVRDKGGTVVRDKKGNIQYTPVLYKGVVHLIDQTVTRFKPLHRSFFRAVLIGGLAGLSFYGGMRGLGKMIIEPEARRANVKYWEVEDARRALEAKQYSTKPHFPDEEPPPIELSPQEKTELAVLTAESLAKAKKWAQLDQQAERVKGVANYGAVITGVIGFLTFFRRVFRRRVFQKQKK